MRKYKRNSIETVRKQLPQANPHLKSMSLEKEGLGSPFAIIIGGQNDVVVETAIAHPPSPAEEETP